MKYAFALVALCHLLVAQAQVHSKGSGSRGYNPCFSLATIRFGDLGSAEQGLELVRSANLSGVEVALHAPFRSIVVSAESDCSDTSWWSSLRRIMEGQNVDLMPGVNIDGVSHPVTGIAMCVAEEDRASGIAQHFDEIGCTTKVLKHLKGQSMVLVEPNANSLDDVLTMMKDITGVLRAFPDHILEMRYNLNVNDADYSDQWFLPAIHADQAWDITTGSASVVVAVVDGGFQTNHPDMAGRITNAYDAVDDDFTLTLENAFDDHGTPCMGLVAARTNNAVGVASVGFNIRVMPIDFNYNNLSDGTFSTSVTIIARAAAHIASVSNVVAVSNSYSSSSFSQARLDEYEVMRTQSRGGLGAVILASMGNEGLSNDPVYPAWYDDFVSVAATDDNDELASFSNYGAMTHVAAPGVSTYTIEVGSGYGNFGGTSAACPIAAGVVGLMASMDLTLTEEELREILESTCEKVGGYPYGNNGDYPNGTWSDELGYGRVNAYGAVVAASGVLPNDACAGAIEIFSGTSCSYTTGTVEGANPDGFPQVPSCDNALGHPQCTVAPDRYGVFYKFTAVSASHTITVDPIGVGAGSLDAVVTVYEGADCFNLDELACEDTPGGQGGTTILTDNGFIPGNEYWIRVYDWCSAGNVTNGSFEICITHENSEDITVQSISSLQPSYTPGETIAINCEQCYSGSTLELDLPNPNIIAYLSTSCDPSDALDSDNESSGIGSDDECNQEDFALDIPLGTPAGTYYIVIVADANDEVEEGSGEFNNTECIPVTIGQGCTTPAVPTPVFGSASCPGPSISSAIPLEWNPVPGAVGYRLRVGIYPYEEGIFIDVGAGDCYPGTSYSVPIALFTTGIPCYWSVSAYGACGDDACQSAYSTPRYFSVPPIALASNGTTICAGESADLSIETFWVVDNPGTNSAQWYRDGLAIPGATGGTYSATQPGGYSVVLTFTGSLWCPDPIELGPSNIIQVQEDNVDSDGDGVPNCTDNCPNVVGQIGSACNDGNPCTTNDLLNAICQCAGTIDNTDTDGDGVPNCTDNCPNVFGQIGSSCNDINPCTTGDILNASCQCTGTLDNTDTDGDGVPNCTDNCPNVFGQIGSACNDGNPCTTNDVLNSSCLCAGTPDNTDTDGDGLADCVDPCPTLANLENGDSCDDGNPNTVNDVVTNCICMGTLLDEDCEGVPGGPAQPGTVCDDLSACTTSDLYDANCNCVGTPVGDSDNDDLCDLIDPCPTLANVEPGDGCDDGDACTTNDQINGSCGCVGSPVGDVDSDGLCDLIDPCPTLANIEPGDACDDSNACTSNDQINGSCGCAGTPLVDIDSDGLCDLIDPCPMLADATPGDTCDDGLAGTENDSLNTDCICVGELITLVHDGSLGNSWFTIFPNPSNGTFQVASDGPINGAIDIRVFDALGQLVAAPVVLSGKQPQRLDLHEKANGIYFLRATRGSESQVLELIIQR